MPGSHLNEDMHVLTEVAPPVMFMPISILSKLSIQLLCDSILSGASDPSLNRDEVLRLMVKFYTTLLHPALH